MSQVKCLMIHSIRDVTVVNVDEVKVLDALQVEQMGEELYNLVDNRNCKKIIIDFSKVRLLSSSALGMLLTLRKKADAIKGRVIFCGMRKELGKVFKLTKLDKMFTFCANEEQALDQFGVTAAG